MNSTLQVRIDSKTKNQVKEVLGGLGLDFSSAIKIYFKQILNTKGIPFRIVTENGFTPEKEIEMINDYNKAIRDYNLGKNKSYKNFDKMMDDVLDVD